MKNRFSRKTSNINDRKVVIGQKPAIPPIPITSALSTNFNNSRIIKEPVDLQFITTEDKVAFLLHNVFTPDECAALIKLSEDTGYSPALVNIGSGRQVLMKDYRDSHRVIIDDKKFVSCLLRRIAPFVPKSFKSENIVEINERLRFLRYDPGDKFQPHYDGSYCRDDRSAATLITLQIYLNEGFEGGETTFLHEDVGTDNRVPVVPKTGTVLVFEHRIFHEGSLLKAGRKYTIRTDVLYTYSRNRNR